MHIHSPYIRGASSLPMNNKAQPIASEKRHTCQGRESKFKKKKSKKFKNQAKSHLEGKAKKKDKEKQSLQ